MRYRLLGVVCFWGVLLSTGVRAEEASAAPVLNVRGTLSAVSGDVLHLRTRHGESLSLRLTSASRLFGVFPASLDDVHPGAFLGAGALPLADGTLEAREIHLFSERLRGAGEGHTAWRMVDGGQGSMTNGTVSAEGTLSGGSVGEHSLVLRYAGGVQRVQVALDTPVVLVDTVTRSALRPGLHVVVTLQRDAGQSVATVQRAFIGVNGVIPPF